VKQQRVEALLKTEIQRAKSALFAASDNPVYFWKKKNVRETLT
jgi:hypothetical protein